MAKRDLRKYSRLELLEMLLRLQRRKNPTSPSVRRLEEEIRRLRFRRRYLRVLAGVTAALLAVVLLSLGLAWRMPVLRITDASMAETLQAGAYVLAAKDLPCARGDLIAFQREDMLLVRRLIAKAGDEVRIDADGAVFVNGQALPEAYIAQPDAGQSEISYPCLVPDNRVFVLGDNRLESVDSRHLAVGTIHKEEILGRVLMQIWPLNEINWHL